MEIGDKIEDRMEGMIGLKEANVNLIMISIIKVSIIDEDMIRTDIKIIEAMIGEMKMIMFMVNLIKEVAMIETSIGITKENNIITQEEISNKIEKIIIEIMVIEEIRMIEEAEIIKFRTIIVNSKILGLVDHKDKMI